MEYYAHVLSAFSQSAFLCFDLIHYIIEKLPTIKDIHQKGLNGLEEDDDQDEDLHQAEMFYHVLRLLSKLLQCLREKFEKNSNRNLVNRREPKNISILDQWKSNWRCGELKEQQCTEESFETFQTTIRQWLVVLEKLLLYSVNEAPLCSAILWDCVTSVKSLITCHNKNSDSSKKPATETLGSEKC